MGPGMHVGARAVLPRLRHFRTGLLLAALSFAANVQAQPEQPLAMARRALDSGNIDQAVRLLEPYRRSHPTNPQVYNLLGIAYGRANDNARSLAMFREFARLSPREPEAFNNLGASYLRAGNDKQAEAAFRSALKLNPADPSALYNLGALLNLKHRYQLSRTVLQRAFQRDHSPAVAYELAVALAGTGDRQGALHILSSTPQPSGNSALPWLRLTG